MAAPPILIFQIHKILLSEEVERAEINHRAKFCQNQSIHCRDIAPFRFFKMAVVRHFGLVWGIFGLYHCTIFGYDLCSSFFKMAVVRHFGLVWGIFGLYHCTIFGYDLCSSFGNMNVSIFGASGGKKSIYAPKICGFGVILPP